MGRRTRIGPTYQDEPREGLRQWEGLLTKNSRKREEADRGHHHAGRPIQTAEVTEPAGHGLDHLEHSLGVRV